MSHKNVPMILYSNEIMDWKYAILSRDSRFSQRSVREECDHASFQWQITHQAANTQLLSFSHGIPFRILSVHTKELESPYIYCIQVPPSYLYFVIARASRRTILSISCVRNNTKRVTTIGKWMWPQWTTTNGLWERHYSVRYIRRESAVSKPRTPNLPLAGCFWDYPINANSNIYELQIKS